MATAFAPPVESGSTAPVVRFAALCETCLWQGSLRLSNLTALADFDRHVDTAGHVLAELVGRTAAIDDDEAPTLR